MNKSGGIKYMSTIIVGLLVASVLAWSVKRTRKILKIANVADVVVVV